MKKGRGGRPGLIGFRKPCEAARKTCFGKRLDHPPKDSYSSSYVRQAASLLWMKEALVANNLFVSYDLHKPDKNYEAVIKAIKEQGGWAKVQFSLFYLTTTKTAEQVCEAVWAAMDSNDSLIVVDTTNNKAVWQNLTPEVSKYIRDNWNSR